MSRLHAIELHLLMLAGIAFLCVSGWQVWRVGSTIDAANGAIVQVDGTVATLNGTLAALNAPCTGFHGSVTCGPIAQLSQTEKNVGIMAGQGALQIKQSAVLVQSAARAVQSASADIHNTSLALAGTANAATGALKQGQTDLSTMNDSLAATKPLIEASTLTVQHYDALSPFLKDIAANGQSMTFHFNAIAGDGQKIADKETTDFLKPTKWYMVPVKRLGEIWDVTAAVARHAP
jgi:hypothetical protein